MQPELTANWLLARVKEDDEGCLIWIGYTTKHGQPQARMNGEQFLVRRAVWENFHGQECPAHLWVGAKCKKPGCCRPECMTARTRSKAQKGKSLSLAHRAAIAHSRRAKSTLSDEAIAEIRASTENARDISRRLGMCDSYASTIRRGARRVDFTNPFQGLGGRA